MTKRQRSALDLMAHAMASRFADNEWREHLPFPSIHELAARAHVCVSAAYRHSLAGSDSEAMKNAADAANLLGLMVVVNENGK